MIRTTYTQRSRACLPFPSPCRCVAFLLSSYVARENKRKIENSKLASISLRRFLCPDLNRNLSPLKNESCVLLLRVKFETGLSVFFQHCKHKRRVSLQTGTTSVKNFLTLFKRNKKDLRIWRAILRALACTISLYRTVSGLSSGHVNRMTALTES